MTGTMKLIRILLLMVLQHGGDDVSCKRRILRFFFVVETRLPTHHAGGIWKRRCYPGNASNVSVHWTPFWICFSGKLGQANHVIIMARSFSKSFVSKTFPSTWNRKHGVFKFLWFENSFRKPPFSGRIGWVSEWVSEWVWTISLTLKSKAAASNSSRVMWMLSRD